MKAFQNTRHVLAFLCETNLAVMAQIPEWINRETIQLTLIVLITMGFHYYFITSKIQEKVDATIAEMEAEEALNAAKSA